MAKKHKHEEHVNHERWLVSFADMMTLLFALFVVLYALGQADLSKLKELKQSVQWAFNITGDGKTKDDGIFDKQQGGGDVTVAVPLITAQNGEMREFLKEVLPEYQEVAGRHAGDGAVVAHVARHADRIAVVPARQHGLSPSAKRGA